MDGNHSLLWLAAKRGDTETVQMLIDSNVDVNENDDSAFLPFPIWAALNHAAANSVNSLSTAQALIDAGVDIEYTNSFGETPLLHFYANRRIFTMLLKAGANIHAVDSKRGSILHLFAQSDNQESILELYDRGINLSHRNMSGCTCFHVAAAFNHPDTILTLLDLDVDINITTNLGQTALYLASAFGSKEVVKVLLARNAEIGVLATIQIPDQATRETARQAAIGRRHIEVASIIEREELRRDRIMQRLRLAFAMGLHHRAGEGSLVGSLGPDIAGMVAHAMRL